MTDRLNLQRASAVFGILLLSCASLFWCLQRDFFLKGTDAYYYALQVDWWAQTGRVRIADGSWIFPVLGEIERLGLATEDVLRGFLVASIVLASAAFWWVGESSLMRRTASSLWIAFSPVMLFAAIEFPKMFVAMALFPLWELRRDRWKILMLIVVVGLALWAHRSAGAILILFALGSWLDRRLKGHGWVWIALLLVLVLTFLLGDRSPIVEMHRFLPSIHLSTPGLFSLISRTSLPVLLKAELTLTATVYAFFLLQKAFQPESPVPFRYLLPGLLAFLPIGSDDVFSLGERFALFLPIFTLLIWCHSQDYPPEPQPTSPGFIALIGVGFITCLVPQTRLDLSHPASLDPDYAQIHQVTKALSQTDIPMLIANKTMAYYYKFALRGEAFPYEPEEWWDKKRIWRLTYHITPEEIWTYLTPDCRALLYRDWRDYLMMREDCWSEARSQIDPEIDSDLFARAWNHVWNPSRRRPAFLYPKHIHDPKDEFPAIRPRS